MKAKRLWWWFSVLKMKKPTGKSVLQELLMFLRSTHFINNPVDGILCFVVWWLGFFCFVLFYDFVCFVFLDEYWQNHPELHDIPIYYASSLAKKCMAVYQTYVNAMNDKIRKQININNPFVFKHISNLKVRLEILTKRWMSEEFIFAE